MAFYLVAIAVVIGCIAAAPLLFGSAPSEPPTRRPVKPTPRVSGVVKTGASTSPNLQLAKKSLDRSNESIRSLQKAVAAIDADSKKVERASHALEANARFQQLKLMHSQSHNLGNACYAQYREARQSKAFLSEQVAFLTKSRSIEQSAIMRSEIALCLSTALETRAELQRCIDRYLASTRNHNNATHALKVCIRDQCGDNGRQWYAHKQNK